MTSTVADKQVTTSNFSERAILVHLSVSKYLASRSDQLLASELAHEKKASKGMATVTKKLLEKGALSEFDAIERRIKKWWEDHSIPWVQKSVRAMPNEFFLDFKKEFGECEALWKEAEDRFFTNFPTKVAEAKAKGGDLLKDEYYPSLEELKTKFCLRYTLTLIPAGMHYSYSKFGELEQKKIQAQIDATTKLATEKAVLTIFKRFIEPLEHMIEKLSEYRSDIGAGTSSKFHDSLISNIEEIIDLIPHLNLTENKDLDDLAKRMKKELCTYSADTLRIDDEIRNKVKDSAADVLQKISDYF